MKILVTPPNLIPLSNILPSEPLLLMGAGPVPIPQAVAQANGVVINHLGDTMDIVIDRVKSMAQYVFQTYSDKIIGIAGPSSAAMEMAVSNLLWSGRKVLILKTGTFSGRLGEMAIGTGAETTVVESSPYTPITTSMVREAMSKKKYDVVTIVQGETSCGLLNVELPEILKVIKEHEALSIVDAVCTLSTMLINMDEWLIDVLITGGQKGLSSIPGVSLLALSSNAWNIIEKRTNFRPHWCLDAVKAQGFWGDKKYHYTAPVPGILALHEALRLICEETLERRFERHKISSEALQTGIEAMGLDLLIPAEYRLNSVVAIIIPENVDSYSIRKYMSENFKVEVSGAFGLNIIRIGQMGEQCHSHNLFKVLYALGMTFKRYGVNLNVGEGMAALEEKLSRR